MSQNPSVRMIREALLQASHAPADDPVAVEALRSDIAALLEEMRRATDRALDFAGRGLVSEAASVVLDFPNLELQADALLKMATTDAQMAARWRHFVGDFIPDGYLPRPDDIDVLADILVRADEIRASLDAMRLSALRREPVALQLRQLRSLREQEPNNPVWLEQILAYEKAWLRSIAELRTRSATRDELEEAMRALATRKWIAKVPETLNSELAAKVKPLRAEEAGVRYGALSDQIHAAFSRMDRADLRSLGRAWETVGRETGRAPSAEHLQIVRPAFDWYARVVAEEEAERAFDTDLKRLDAMVRLREPPGEIATELERLQATGREVPEPLRADAYGYIEAARRAARRRGNLKLAAIIVGIAMVGLLVAMTIALLADRAKQQARIASLRETMARKDAAGLARLVSEIRGSEVDRDSELAHVLAEAEAYVASRDRKSKQIRESTALLRREIEARPTKLRLVAIRAELLALRAEAEQGELAEITRTTAECDGALEEFDAETGRQTTRLLAEIETSLDPWRSPDRWKDREYLDVSRWDGYLSALEGAIRKLTDAERRVDGHAPSMELLHAARMDIVGRLSQAKEGAQAVRTAARDLSADSLLAPVPTEEHFLQRLSQTLRDHRAAMERQGLVPGFEQALGCAEAYRAMKAWRSDIQPRLTAALQPEILVSIPPDAAALATQGIRDYLSSHPASPMQEALGRVEAVLKVQASIELWPAAQVATALAARKFALIEEVPLTGGRKFYRRPAQGSAVTAPQRQPLNRALKSISELAMDAEKLSSIFPAVQAQEIIDKPYASPISSAWSACQSAVSSAPSNRIGSQLLELLGKLEQCGDCDQLFRLRAMYEASQVVVDSGHGPAGVRSALRAWRRRCEMGAPIALAADWALAAYDPQELNWRKARSEAKDALEDFPRLTRLLAAEEAGARDVFDSLASFVPVGVIAPRGQDVLPRIVRLSGDQEDLRVLSIRSGGWKLVPIEVANGRLVQEPEGLPAGPALLYARQPVADGSLPTPAK